MEEATLSHEGNGGGLGRDGNMFICREIMVVRTVDCHCREGCWTRLYGDKCRNGDRERNFGALRTLSLVVAGLSCKSIASGGW